MMQTWMRTRWFLVTLILAVSFLPAKTISEVRRIVDFSQLDLEFRSLNSYDLVRMKGASVMSELGKPVLPIKGVKIALPYGTKAVRVKANSMNAIELPGDFYVMPGQPPLPIGVASNMLTESPDPQVYESSNPYPGNLATLDRESNLAGQQIAWLTIYPVQYLASQRKLVLHTTIELTVECEYDDLAENKSLEHYYKFTEMQRTLYEDMIKSIVINPENVHLIPSMGSPSRFLPPGDYDHVIVTSSAFSSSLGELVYWHNKKGLRDTVVTMEYIAANYSGPGDTLELRQFVIDANSTWGTMYFFFVGEDEIVPFDWRYYTGEYPDQICPSDQYYSDFDDDWTHEVYVGRIPVENTSEIELFLDKLMKYEKDPPLTNYCNEVLLIGMDLDGSSPGEETKEAIDLSYIPAYVDVNKVYDSHGGIHIDSATAYINAGQNLINHCDHSNQTYMGCGSLNHNSGFTNGLVDYFMNNGETSTIVSVGCDPNRMDFEDCIAEHFIIYNDSQAGVAFVGNTRHGWYYVGNPGGLSGELDDAWWQGVYTQNQATQGQALIYSKHDFAQGFDATRRHCEWTFCLQGEPAMPIWTNDPDTLVVSFPKVVRAQPGNFTVTVKAENGVTLLQNALVCAWIQEQTPELYATGLTNASGQVTLSISPTTPGDTMLVTVTKQNYLPHENFALITTVSGPFIVNGTMDINDIGGNGLVNPGENVDLGIYGVNIGFNGATGVYGLISETDPYVTVNTDSGWHGNIASFDSTVNNPYYDFNVTNNCPDAHVIEFTLEFHDVNDTVWTTHPQIIVHAPLLTYQDYDVLGGTWNNGILDPAETANLVVTLMNEGSAPAQSITSTLITYSPTYITINDGSASFGTISPGATGDNSGSPYNVTASGLTPFSTPVDFGIIVQSGVYLDTIDFTLIVGQDPPTDTGYYYAYYSGGAHYQAPAFSWYAIDSTQTTHPGTSLNLSSNQTAVVNLPFTFKYYGVNYNKLSVCSNGWVALDSTDSFDNSNTAIPNSDGPPNMIAGIWDYLNPGAANQAGDIYYYYDSANHRFIVEYFKVDHYPSGNPETFEIMLYDPAYYPAPSGNGDIVVQYLTEIAVPSGVTVGIENSTETVGIQYLFNGTYDSLAVAITDSFAIRYRSQVPFGIEEISGLSSIPLQTMLNVLYPNPFANVINISYQLANPTQINLVVYDVMGRSVRELAQGNYPAGYYTLFWNGCDDFGRRVPAGVYFVRFSANDYNRVEKAVLMK